MTGRIRSKTFPGIARAMGEQWGVNMKCHITGRRINSLLKLADSYGVTLDFIGKRSWDSQGNIC